MTKPRANPYSLKWFQATTLYSSLGLLFLTGVLLGFKERWGICAPFSTALLQIHGYCVPLFLASFGSVLAKHVAVSWKAGRNRVSGAPMIAACSLLIVTGALLYYLGSDFWREIVRVAHLWVGLSLVPLIGWHVVAGLRSRTKTHHAPKKHK